MLQALVRGGPSQRGRNREPPSATPPPAYTVQRFTRTQTNLRPVVLIVSFFSAVWGLIVASVYLRNRGDAETPASLDTVYLALGIVYFVCVAVEVFGFFAAWKASLPLVRSYFYGSLAVAFLATAAELVRTIFHFTQKSAILKACEDSYSADIANGQLTSTTVTSYCHDSWRNASYVDIALLIFSFLISFIFASLAASFLHQLKNPQSLRTHTAALAPSAQYAYPLAPYPPGPGLAGSAYPASASPYAMPPPHYAGPGVGGALPAYDNPYGVTPSEEKLPSAAAAAAPLPPAENPFADAVEHAQPEREPVRREGESGDDFERRQHEWNVRRYGESTETVTLEPRRT
ncbi:hypothetical protein JCM3770_000565 [Rhodotorula araucariae]